MADEERLIVALEAKVSDFEKRMRKAEQTGTRSYMGLRRGSNSATRAMEMDMNRATTSINRALATTSSRIGTFGKTMAAGLAGGLVAGAVAGLTGSLSDVVKGIAAVGDEARRSGLSAQTFQEWKFVAEQNRIGVDALVDGFKELNLRADEFVVTGKGPAAEAFQRIGYSARDLKRGLEDPSELMLEIIKRMEDLDRAAQIRVADEIFGGTAGERFVELLAQGERGLRRTIDRAHEVGAVMDDEMIEKAADLDRRFGEIAEKVGRIGKGLAVGIADTLAEMTDFTTALEDIFSTPERARAILGDGVADLLAEDNAALEEHADALTGIDAGYREMARSAELTAGDIERAVVNLRALGEHEIADELLAAVGAMRDLARQMDDGTISADEFDTRLGDVAMSAQTALDRLNDVDRVEFSGVIGAVGGLVRALGAAIERAVTLRDTLPSDPEGRPHTGPTSRRGTRAGRQYTSRMAPTTSIRPQLPSVDASFGVPDPKTGGGGRGGGSSRGDEYQREVEGIRQKTAALEAEAAALVAVATSGKSYGDAVEYARKRAELLVAAQEAGREITPELRAEIDQLAAGYVMAGENADTAADRLEHLEEAAENAAERMTDIFTGILDGSKSAKEAIGDLIKEFARMQMQKGFASLIGVTGGGGGILGRIFGFRAGGGPVIGGAPYMVNENTPNSEIFVPSRSGAVLNVPQAQAALRQAATPAASGGTVELILHAADGVTIEEVQNTAGAMIRQAAEPLKRETMNNMARKLRHQPKGSTGLR